MKKVPVEQAVGMPLCHDITAMRDGFKGAAFRRGHVIEAGDVEKLKDLGKRTVFIWEENAGELHEEDCALRMAGMAPVAGAHYTGPSEGKVLLMTALPWSPGKRSVARPPTISRLPRSSRVVLLGFPKPPASVSSISRGR